MNFILAAVIVLRVACAADDTCTCPDTATNTCRNLDVTRLDFENPVDTTCGTLLEVLVDKDDSTNPMNTGALSMDHKRRDLDDPSSKQFYIHAADQAQKEHGAMEAFTRTSGVESLVFSVVSPPYRQAFPTGTLPEQVAELARGIQDHQDQLDEFARKIQNELDESARNMQDHQDQLDEFARNVQDHRDQLDELFARNMQDHQDQLDEFARKFQNELDESARDIQDIQDQLDELETSM